VKSDPNVVGYGLGVVVNFDKVTDNILCSRKPDRMLVVGNGGRSRSLSWPGAGKGGGPVRRVGDGVGVVVRLPSLVRPPNGFGVFEGRTRSQGIARDLKTDTEAGHTKAMGRVTVWQNPEA
jgi:hypothetical protein